MMYKEYAGNTSLKWLGADGTDTPIPVFGSLPDPAKLAPMCTNPTVLPSTLATDTSHLAAWFASGEKLIAHAEHDVCADHVIEWFGSIAKTQTLGSLPAAVFGCGLSRCSVFSSQAARSRHPLRSRSFVLLE